MVERHLTEAVTLFYYGAVLGTGYLMVKYVLEATAWAFVTIFEYLRK